MTTQYKSRQSTHINRRDFLKLSAVAILGAFISLSLLAGESTVSSRPNIVLIIGDDQGFGDYGFMGHPVIKTPNLDKAGRRKRTFHSRVCDDSVVLSFVGNHTDRHIPSPARIYWERSKEGYK